MATLGPYNSDGQGSSVQSKLTYSVSRNATSYTVSFSLIFNRTNTYSGSPTKGTATGYVYLNGSQIATNTKTGFTVPNDKSNAVLVSGSKTVSLSALSSGSFTIGYSCKKGSTGSSAYFAVSKKTSGSISVGAYATGVGKPTVTISDNGNNTFSIKATKGSSGTNNAAKSVSGIGYSFDNSTWTSGSSGSVTANKTVYARAYTTGTYNNSDYASTSKAIKYYSKPGKPTVRISDNGSGTVTISATKGSNGSNNASTSVTNVQYSFDNSTWINYSSPFTISSSQTVYARARTKGTYTGNNNAYLYSAYTVVSSSVTAITKCDKPILSLSSTMLHFNDNNLILSISATPGINNDITRYEIQYSGSDTLTFTNWSTSLSLSTSEDDYDYDFATVTSYFNTLKSLNKKYICFRVKTIGSVSGYDSDYNYISIMTDKGYPRFKNSDGAYETCIPYTLKDGIWAQCVLNSSVLSKLKDNSGEYILDNNGENIYTLEDSSVILNS